MKRLIILALGLILASGGLMAQQDTLQATKKKLFKLHFTGGAAYSIPLGDYKDIDWDNDYSGYAGGGFNVSLGFNWIGKVGFGLGASYVFQYNSLKDTAENVVPDGHQFELGTKAWNNHYLLAGPVYYQSFGKVTVEAGILVGIVVAMSPNFYITLPAVDSLSQPTTSQGAGMGFAYKLTAGVGYQVSRRVSLSANISYLGGSPSRTKDYYYYHYEEDPIYGLIPVYQGAEVTIKKKISTINPGIGITVKL